MGWGVDGKGTEFPTKPFDYEAARASMAEEKPEAALCVHEWERESVSVSVSSLPGLLVWGRRLMEGKAFPCVKCGSLLVLQEREG